MLPTHFLSLLLLLLFPRGQLEARSVRTKRHATSKKSDLWPNWIVRFHINYDFSQSEAEKIKRAMKEWEAFSCLKFVEAQRWIGKLVYIHRDSGGCSSDVGAAMAQPKMNLGPSCMTHHILLHELGHLLGLYHEHTRPDRDEHINVKPWLTKRHMRHTFDIQHDTRTFGLPYSLQSIMHYSKADFVYGRDLTIMTRNPEWIDRIGRGDHLSFRDVQLVNFLYDCANCSMDKPCPEDGFVGPNCRCWCPHDDFTAVDCETGLAIDPHRVKTEHGRIIADRRFGHTYFGSSSEVSWFDARRKCKSIGGHLLDIDKKSISKRLFKVISLFLQNRFHPKKSSFWVGGNDLKEEGKFEWSTGEEIKFNAWNAYELDNGRGLNDDCLQVKPNPHERSYMFMDGDCGHKAKYICELPHKGCFDHSPTCEYFSRIGECNNRAKRCPKSCGLCGVGSPSPSPAPFTSSPSPPSTLCHQLTCISDLSDRLLEGIKVGHDICVHCPPCSCLRPNYGFRIYPKFARICCAIVQMTNLVGGGLHIITRHKGDYHFPAGVKNGITSIRAGPAVSAFTVKGQEPRNYTEDMCVRFACHNSPRQSRIFNRLALGKRMCISCPECACTDIQLFGFGTFQKRSLACCAAVQMSGENSGRFIIQKVWGRSVYPSGIKNGVRSRRTFARDDFAFRFLGKREN